MGKDKRYICDLAVIGAGASGCMAAITAAREGKKVIVLEQKDKIGKKITATGNGKCNFTNDHMTLDAYRGNIELVKSVFSVFGKEQTLSFFQGLGILPKNKNGYFYPNSEQAVSITNALELEMKRLDITIFTQVKLCHIERQKDFFSIETNEFLIKTKKIIVATGLLASPQLGSDGSAFGVIKELGHHFTPIVPALCGFEAEGCKFKNIAGVRAEGKITVYVEKKMTAQDTGEIQLTDYGVSGIPVFQVSRYISMGLFQNKKVIAELDFMPNMSMAELQKEIIMRLTKFYKEREIADVMNGLLNQKLMNEICRISGYALNTKVKPADINETAEKLAHAIKKMKINILKARDYKFAQICAGGIDSNEINSKTLESEIIPGLYFCGEILDVDGICGGYNLQWAWSSGYYAAIHAIGK